MAKNQLLEAAADILSRSKETAPSMPMQKYDDEIHDLGGPTPENNKPDDDSNKIHATKAVGDYAAKNKSSISTKPSKASPDKQEMLGKGQKTMHEEEVSEDEVISESEEETMDLTEDINAMFGDEQISEEFRSKVTTIFEARVYDKVSQIKESLEQEYAQMFEEAVDSVKEDLTEKVNDYLSYVVEQWIADNEIAIETGLRAELTEEFIAGLRNLFAEHYIDVPSEKVDLVEELASKVEELESKLNEEMETSIELSKALIESRKIEIVRDVSEGLTATQVEKVKSLAEGVEFSTEEEYTEKLETIRENYFPSGVKKAEEKQLHEQVEDSQENNRVIADPFVNAVTQAISKTKV